MSEYIFGEFAPDAAKDNANVLTECLNMRYDVGGYMNVLKDTPFDVFTFTGINLPPAGSEFIASVGSRNLGWVVPPDGATVISCFKNGSLYNVYRKQRFSGEGGFPGTPIFETSTNSHIIKHSLINFGNTAMFAQGGAGKAKRRDHSSGNWFEMTNMTYNSFGLFTVRDFVFSIFPNIGEGCAIEWSDINSPTSWGGSGLSDNQAFPTGGTGYLIVPTDARADVGGESLYIFQENAIRRGTFVGDSTFVFKFDIVADQMGCLGVSGACQLKGNVYFCGKDGFYKIENRNIIPIGEGRVFQYFKEKCAQGTFLNGGNLENGSYSPPVIVQANPILGEVFFHARTESFVPDGSGFKVGPFNLCLIYNPDNNTWREREGEWDRFHSLTASDGRFFCACPINGSLETGIFGDDTTRYNDYACLATSPMRSNLGGRVLVNSVYPNVSSNPNQTFLRYATTNKVGDARTYSTQRSLNSDNKFPIRASGKDVTIKLEFTSSDAAPNPVTNCSGIDVDVVQIGQR